MARYTDQQDFTFNNARHSRVIVVDTSVNLEAWNGIAWVADQNSPLLTGNHEITTRGMTLRFTPNSDGYFIEEGERK